MDADFSRSESDFLNYLLTRASSDLSSQISTWNFFSSGEQNDWAVETAKAACKYAYRDQNGNAIGDGFDLDQEYYKFVLETVEQQLVKSGVRLAALLNVAFSGGDEDLQSNVRTA